jgi:SH3-like domain-containing protein
MTLRAVELRKGPGSSFEIVDSLPPGYALEGVLTTDRQWLRVKPGAFVSVDAVQFHDPTAAGYQDYWVGSNIANIREFPLITARVLRKAEPGTELKLQLFNNEWAQVAGGGFVFRKLVTQEAPRILQLPAVMRVTVEKAEIRGGPGAQYPVLGLYFRNHKVEVQAMQSGWLRVGPEQYMRSQELELSVKPSSEKTM